MRDQALTVEQAARWLECTEEEVQTFLAAGRLRSFGEDSGTVSLNSIVVLAESLPVEQGVFRVREMSMAGGDGGGYGGKPHGSSSRPQGERSGFIVERRPPGRRI